MNRLMILCGALLFLVLAELPALAQPPSSCKPPAAVAKLPAGTPPARMYDAAGVWFAQNGQLDCSIAAFKQALRLEPRSAEAHFDLGLVWQRKEQPTAAAKEFRLALQYDSGLLQAHCALGSVLSDPASAEGEFRKALAVNPRLVCALDGMAQVLASGKRYDAAMDYWRRAVKIQPDASDLQLSLATATYKAAKARGVNGLPPVNGSTVADAIRLLTRLLGEHPGMTAAHFTLGNIYANEKLFHDAADEYRVVVRQDPTNIAALGAEIKALINVSAYTEALAPARDYVRQKPDDSLGYILLGTVYMGQGDYAKAEPELKLGASMAPDNFEVRYQLGLALVHLGKPDQALHQLRKAHALRPSDRAAQFQLATVLHALGQKQEVKQIVGQLQSEEGGELLKSHLASEGNKADGLLESGKPKEAAEVYRHMLEESPDSAQTDYNLALALEAMHDTMGAESALRNATDIDPKLASVRAELGKLELADGNLQSAQKWLESALELSPDLVEARGNLAMVYARKGDLVSAEKSLRQAVEDDPKFKEGHLRLGLILVQQDRKADADEELDKALALAPQDPATLSTVGKAKIKMGQVSEGIALLQKVVALAPKMAAAHLDLALALADRHNLQAALVQSGEAVRLAPQSGFAHFYRGRILYDLGRITEAQMEFETACRLNPQMPKPRYFLGIIAKNQGRLPLAVSRFEETVKLQPHDAMAWFMLGQSLEQQSDTVKALAAWRKVIAIDPKFGQALFSMARALRSTDRAESDRLMTRYIAVQKEQRTLDRADTLSNSGIAAAAAHDWPQAIRQLKEAIAVCGDCSAKPDLYRKLGIIDCQAGNLEHGKRELLTAKALKPGDPVTEAALELIAQAQGQHSASVTSKPQ